MSLIKNSAIKKVIKEAGLRISKDSFPHFERKLNIAIQNAIQMAKNDRRQTIRPEDIS